MLLLLRLLIWRYNTGVTCMTFNIMLYLSINTLRLTYTSNILFVFLSE